MLRQRCSGCPAMNQLTCLAPCAGIPTSSNPFFNITNAAANGWLFGASLPTTDWHAVCCSALTTKNSELLPASTCACPLRFVLAAVLGARAASWQTTRFNCCAPLRSYSKADHGVTQEGPAAPPAEPRLPPHRKVTPSPGLFTHALPQEARLVCNSAAHCSVRTSQCDTIMPMHKEQCSGCRRSIAVHLHTLRRPPRPDTQIIWWRSAQHSNTHSGRQPLAGFGSSRQSAAAAAAADGGSAASAASGGGGAAAAAAGR